MFSTIKKSYNKACLKSVELAGKNSNLLMFLGGAALLSFGMNELAQAQIASARAQQACSFLLGYLETGFGALLAAGAGLGAVVASALGGFKAAWCLVVVSVGAFILRAYITLFNAGC